MIPMRQLTYRIPLEIMSRTSLIQTMLAKEAINVNATCSITYESLHTAEEVFSEMVITMYVRIGHRNHVHRAMQKAIAVTLALYSPSTKSVRVVNEPIMTDDFNLKEVV